MALAMAALQARGIDPLVAIGRTQPHRPDDVRPPPPPKAAQKIEEPWRLAMQAKLETEDAKTRSAKRKQTVEWVFGSRYKASWTATAFLRARLNRVIFRDVRKCDSAHRRKIITSSETGES